MKKLVRRLAAFMAALTPKQKEAIGRHAHTLSAAAIIAGATFTFGDGSLTTVQVLRTAALFVVAVLLWIVGVHLSKGD